MEIFLFPSKHSNIKTGEGLVGRHVYSGKKDTKGVDIPRNDKSTTGPLCLARFLSLSDKDEPSLATIFIRRI